MCKFEGAVKFLDAIIFFLMTHLLDAHTPENVFAADNQKQNMVLLTKSWRLCLIYIHCTKMAMG